MTHNRLKIALSMIAAFAIVSMGNLQAQEKKTSIGLYANPGGFALMGPTVGAELTLGGNFIIDAAFRFTKMGAIMAVVTDFEYAIDGSTEVRQGYSGSICAKYYFAGEKGGWYAGPFLDYGYLGYLYLEYKHWVGYSYGIYPSMSPLGFGVNSGYKFQLKSGLYFRTGLWIGGMLTGEIKYYDSQDNLLYTEESGFWPYGNLDISVGFRFGKK